MKYILYIFLLAGLATFFSNCTPKADQQTDMKDTVQADAKAKIKIESFGQMPDGTAISKYTLTNSKGMTMQVINLGGVITSLTAPDRNGKFEDVVLGYDSLAGYIAKGSFFGALVGRYGNRIGNAKFVLDGKTFELEKNNGPNNLHGGAKGFDKRVWTIEEMPTDNGAAIKLSYTSADMEGGFPGNLQTQVIYHLTDSNELKINYRATTDKKTIVNLTNHTYFNLSGNTQNDILNHELMINADRFVPVDAGLIPLGPLKDVSGTPFDFRTPTVIGARIDKDDEQLKVGKGYDHCWVLSNPGDSAKVAATVHDPSNGRVLSVYTTEPGIQVYTGNFLDGSVTGKYGSVYMKRFAICLETEHFPDSPNKKDYPSVVLNPGEVYKTQTVYTFSVK
jgi:aldose 1-epimerase